jgi:multidrug transporter EmrE-like cation transporter
MNAALLLVLVTAFLNTAAQLLLKAAMNRVGEFSFSFANILPIGWQLATNPFLIAGLGIYVISVVVWLLVLSRVDVSAAYPLMSVGFIINAVAAYYLLNEPLSALRIAGIIVIILGVYLVTRSVG